MYEIVYNMVNNQHTAVVIGGAVAGSEAAYQFAQNNINTIVVEKNALPYGKIEDGLPKWHVKLRNREIDRIKEKLNHPLIKYIPNTELGVDISISELASWNCSAVVLANGAWKDRPLPIAGIDKFVDKGFIYQNDFIYWFNHQHSIDCAKATMFHLVNKALKTKGIDTNLFEMEHGISKVLDKHNIPFESLDIEPCTIYYRKRIIDMPLTPQEVTTDEALQKAQKTRLKIINHNKAKFLFKVKELAVPVEIIVEENELKGLVFNNTYADDSTYRKLENDLFEIRTPQIISSIGSIPIPLEGLPMDGSVYKFDDDEICRLSGFENFYALGNAVTGRGNINQSLKHATNISQKIINEILTKTKLEPNESLNEKVVALQNKVNYNGDFNSWADQHLPVRLEQMLEHS